jgi:hypothetical protein
VASSGEYGHEPGFHRNRNQYAGFQVLTAVVMKPSKGKEVKLSLCLIIIIKHHAMKTYGGAEYLLGYNAV